MTPERRNFLIALVVVVAGVGVLLIAPWVREELAPELETARVAIEPEGSGMAVAGTVELPAGESFRLHAVLEARRRDGSKVYYSEAPALRFGDAPPVAAEDLRPWDRPQEVRVLWFTIEGTLPYVEIGPGQTLEERFRMGEFLRVDWPQTWSIPGSLDPANDDSLARQGAVAPNPFGTQRFHVRIELYDRGSRLIPSQRYASWAAADVAQHGEELPAVVASLPGAIGPASALFGLTQIEPAPDTGGSLLRRIRELTRQRIAFSRLTALSSLLTAAGRGVDDLTWRLVSLDGALPWSKGPGDGGVEPGDLLRVGDRVVVVYRDQGDPGVLDRQDLCFDYARGAAVRPLSDVFAGGGDVELAPLAPSG